jgi:putative phosphotransacetylase
MQKVKIEVSARHIHLSQQDLVVLFGINHQLQVFKDLSQPGQFSAMETLDIKNKNNIIKNVRVVGPIRENTQVELSLTDCYLLKINAPVLVSGNLNNSVGGVTLIGPNGSVDLKKGVIVAQRHLHIEPNKANELNIKTGDLVSIKIDGQRSLIYNNIATRSRQNIDKLAVHLDTDEANAASINNTGEGELIL